MRYIHHWLFGAIYIISCFVYHICSISFYATICIYTRGNSWSIRQFVNYGCLVCHKTNNNGWADLTISVAVEKGGYRHKYILYTSWCLVSTLHKLLVLLKEETNREAALMHSKTTLRSSFMPEFLFWQNSTSHLNDWRSSMMADHMRLWHYKGNTETDNLSLST